MPGDFDGILRWPQVHALVGLSRSTIWRLVRAGQFPTPIKISRRALLPVILQRRWVVAKPEMAGWPGVPHTMIALRVLLSDREGTGRSSYTVSPDVITRK